MRPKPQETNEKSVMENFIFYEVLDHTTLWLLCPPYIIKT